MRTARGTGDADFVGRWESSGIRLNSQNLGARTLIGERGAAPMGFTIVRALDDLLDVSWSARCGLLREADAKPDGARVRGS
jgi:hypothetical protein